MKVITENTPSFYFAPRIYPELTDTLTVFFTNEYTKEVISPSFTFTIESNLVNLELSNISGFSLYENYEFEIKLDDLIIYKGKIITLDNDTDIQNYQPDNQSKSRWE